MTKPIRILSSPDCHSIYSTHIMIVGIAQPCHEPLSLSDFNTGTVSQATIQKSG